MGGAELTIDAPSLRFNAEHTVGPLTEAFDPKAFFKDREGLYVWNGFTKNLLPRVKRSEPTEAVALKSFDLASNANDSKIKAELPTQYEVELWQIAKLIEAQSNGEDGPLQNNGFANIFYVSGFVVYVDWYAAGRKWFVRGWDLDDVDWDAGRRVFSRN